MCVFLSLCVSVCEGVRYSVCNEIFLTKTLYKNNIVKIHSKEFPKCRLASLISVSALRVG